jgi:hypothetical protein
MLRWHRRNRSISIALWANAILLGGILISMLSRTSGINLPAAMAEQAPIAGGAGVFVMPGQLADRSWGCYLLDVDRQTLAVYEYFPGEHRLHFMAGRSFKYDRDMTNFGTTPSPEEIHELVDKEKNGLHRAADDKPGG